MKNYNFKKARRHLVIPATGIALALALSSTQAFAQDAVDPEPKAAPNQSDDGIAEIVVTARFKAENSQRTPIALTALSADALAARGATRIDDIAASTPGVTLQQNTGGFGKSVLAFIRGVGQNDFIPAFEPGVGLYVDDVYQGTLFGGLFDLTDVGQVEILRGPQGTLFGKNNEGGAVRISSIRPRGDGTGFMEAGYGSFNRVQVKGAFDISLIPDIAALRISGGVNSYDGYVKVVDFVCAHPNLSGTLPRSGAARGDGSCVTGHTGGDSVTAVKANLLITPNSDLSFNVVGDFMRDRGEPTAERLLAVNNNAPSVLSGFPTPMGLIPGYGNPSVTGFGIPFDSRFITTDPYSTYATYSDPRTGQNFPAVSNVTSWGVSGRIEWKIAPNLSLTSVTGYRGFQGEFTEIWGNAPIHINDDYYRPRHTQFSQEIRLSGQIGSDLIDWSVGGYYFSGHSELNDFVYLPELTVFNAIDPSATKPGLVFYGTSPVNDRDKSGFVHIVAHPTEKLSLEAGVRYSDVSKKFGIDRLVPSGYAFAPVVPGFNPRPVIKSGTSRFDYRASASYQVTSSIMTYAAFSTGFKGPGVNPRPLTFSEVMPFAEEDLKSYEIGIKSQYFNNRLRLNATGYQSDYTNLQLSTIAPGTSATVVSNAGKVRIRGAEVEIEADPIHGLNINGSLSYTDFKYKDLGAAAGVGDGPCLTCTAPFVPKWQASAGVQYVIEAGSVGSITPRIDWSYRSKTYNDLSNSQIASTPGYSVFNGRINFQPNNSDWSMSVEVKNLFDKLYYPNKFNQLNGAGILVGQIAPPRTWLLSVRRNFK